MTTSAKLLYRDPREVERKKTGQPKARKHVRILILKYMAVLNVSIIRSTPGSSVRVLVVYSLPSAYLTIGNAHSINTCQFIVESVFTLFPARTTPSALASAFSGHMEAVVQ
jgi:hypothetical protein